MLTDEQLAQLTPEQLAFLEEVARNQRYNKLDFWKPFRKQWDFIALGLTCAERCLFAGNQVGKSETGAYETTCHLTGLYPEDWPGYRFNGPTFGWACGVSGQTVRDVLQEKLLGQPGVVEAQGTGMIPKHCIVGKPTLARGGVSDSIDTVNVKHFNRYGIQDGVSQLWFKSYDQQRQRFQGPPRHFVWFDEEPPMEIYTEGLARLTATKGISWMTFTPLLALSDVVLQFTKDQGIGLNWHGSMIAGKGSVRMDYLDNPNYTVEDLERQKNKYPSNEWDARLHGLPVLGAGRVFTQDPSTFAVDPSLEVPLHWKKLWGIDFGMVEKHPFAGVLTAWDVEEDVIYVLRGFKDATGMAWLHADRLRQLGGDIPIAWPHDGHDKGRAGTGDELAVVYRKLGLPMLGSHSTWPEGGFETERAVLEINQRIATGRLRVAANMRDWIDEYLQYHRDEKTFKLVKQRDDLLSATMKALMMRRSGRPGPIGSVTNRPNPGGAAHSRNRKIGAFNLFTGEAEE